MQPAFSCPCPSAFVLLSSFFGPTCSAPTGHQVMSSSDSRTNTASALDECFISAETSDPKSSEVSIGSSGMLSVDCSTPATGVVITTTLENLDITGGDESGTGL
ncbi:hypothetical protein OH77DRAFT_1432288 [Trametes cingulata]|nr:hypothetical protein OH77DRAFT_1432288 [Trametes cingulata]